MAVDGPQAPTRKELATALGDNQRLIRAFERIFDLLPSQFNIDAEAIEEAIVSAGLADSSAASVLSRVEAVADALALLQLAPAPNQAPSLSDALQLLELAPPVVPVVPLLHGEFASTTDDVPAVANTAQAVDMDVTIESNGIVIDAGTPSRVVVNAPGVYSVSASFQISSTVTSGRDFWFWIRKNGADIANSAGRIRSAGAYPALTRPLLVSMAAGDYVEAYWAADNTDVALESIAATAFAPAAPACILTIEQIR